MLRLCLVVLSVTTIAQTADAAPDRRVLTLRSADRAIDLAWQAELAGDAAGARAGLEALVRTATLAMETPARARIAGWLEGQAARERAFHTHGRTARGYHDALATLEGFGLERSGALLARARRDLPQLAAVPEDASRANVKVEAVRGPVPRGTVERTFSDFLQKHGHAAAQLRSRYEARVDLDATEAETTERSSKVTARATVVLRALDARGKTRPMATVSKHRTERRRTETEARSFAVRRVLDDAGASIVHLIQLAVLADLAERER